MVYLIKTIICFRFDTVYKLIKILLLGINAGKVPAFFIGRISPLK